MKIVFISITNQYFQNMNNDMQQQQQQQPQNRQTLQTLLMQLKAPGGNNKDVVSAIKSQPELMSRIIKLSEHQQNQQQQQNPQQQQQHQMANNQPVSLYFLVECSCRKLMNLVYKGDRTTKS